MVVAEVCSSMKYPKRCQYKHAKQKKYHVRNWAEYNEGLRRRGDLTVWFDEEAITNWKADKTGKPGGQRVYSDMAIETGLVVRMVYKLAYRQTEGFLHSITSLLGLGIEVPDYSTLCRRSRLLRKKLRIPKAASTQPIHLMIDSTGLRIHVGNARKPVRSKYSCGFPFGADISVGSMPSRHGPANQTPVRDRRFSSGRTSMWEFRVSAKQQHVNQVRNQPRVPVLCQNSDSHDIPKRRPTALGPVANTDTKLLIYGLFQKSRVLAQDAARRASLEFVCVFGQDAFAAR